MSELSNVFCCAGLEMCWSCEHKRIRYVIVVLIRGKKRQTEYPHKYCNIILIIQIRTASVILSLVIKTFELLSQLGPIYFCGSFCTS